MDKPQTDNGEAQDPHGITEEITGLIHTALYDTSGEMVEGGFVDRWEPNDARAIDDLTALYRKYGFSAQEAERYRAIMRDDTLPLEQVVALIRGLSAYTRPLIVEMRRDENPRAQLVAKQVGALLFDPLFWLESLEDPDAEVRVSAVHSLARNRHLSQKAEEYLIRALHDSDSRVREAAGVAVTFYKAPAGGDALIRMVEAETNQGVRKSVLTAIAREVRRLGTHLSHAQVAESIGPNIKSLLLRELNHADAEIRELVASALERLRGEDVATAMLERLLVEQERAVRWVLVLFSGYPAIRERAFPVLASLLRDDPDATIRTRVAWLMEYFGPAAIPPLIAALDDEEGARRPAAVTLGKIGDLSALPALSSQLANPANRYLAREIADAMRYLLIRATHANPPTPQLMPSPDLSAQIQARINAVVADDLGSWPIRFLKEEHNALTLHGTVIYLWGIQPNGQIVCLDHEAFSRPVEIEENGLTRFAVVVNGARDYPELRALVPVPPKATEPCLACNTLGYRQEEAGSNWCMSCSGLGWVVRVASP